MCRKCALVNKSLALPIIANTVSAAVYRSRHSCLHWQSRDGVAFRYTLEMKVNCVYFIACGIIKRITRWVGGRGGRINVCILEYLKLTLIRSYTHMRGEKYKFKSNDVAIDFDG